MKENKWSVKINDSIYEIRVSFSFKNKQQILFINDKPQISPSTSFWKPELDYCFYIENHKLNLVTLDGKCDLAVDNVYQTSGSPYKARKVALWGWILMAVQLMLFAAMLIVPILLSGAVSVWILLALPGTIFTIFGTYRFSSSSILSIRQKIIKPIICTVCLVVVLINLILASIL